MINRSLLNSLNIVCRCALLLGLLSVTARAASHTWSGAVNGYFSNAGNWSSGGVPTLAETNSLTFPAGATRFTVTNDIGALKITAITFSGSNYIVRGASTLAMQANLISINCSGGSNTIESAMSFGGIASLVVGTGDSLVLAGALSGTNGLVKNGVGNLYLRGAVSNPLTGSMFIYSGELHLQKSGGALAYVGSSLSIGTTDVGDPTQVYLRADDQISDNTTLSIQPSGAFLMNGFNDIVGEVAMHSGIIQTGTNTLVIGGDLNLSPRHVGGLTYESPTIQGKIEFSGASANINVSSNICNIDADIVENGTTTALNKTGPGTLSLDGGGNFTGALNIQQGRVIAVTSSSLGAITGGTTVANGATLEVRTGVGTSEPLTLAGLGNDGQGVLQLFSGSATMSGLITLTSEAGISARTVGDIFSLDGPISGAGGIRKFGDGQLLLNGFGNNTFSGASFVAKGRLTLNKAANVRAIGSVTVTNGASLVFNQNELMDNAGVLSLYTGASVNLTNRNETIGGLNIGGGQTLDTGTGTLTLLGDVFFGMPYATNYAPPAVVRGNLSLGGGMRSIISTNFDKLMFDCAISDGGGAGGLNLSSGGTMGLLRSNSFTGPVLLSGACIASNAFAFGAPGGNILATNASITLALSNMVVSGESLTCAGFSSVGFYGVGSNVWNGSISIVDSNTVFFFSAFNRPQSKSLTLNGSISGACDLFYVDTARLILTASNSFSGPVLMNGPYFSQLGGQLILRNKHALGNSQEVRVLEGGNLRLELAGGDAIAGKLLSLEGFDPVNSYTWLTVVGAVSNAWNGPVMLSGMPVQISVEDPAGTLMLGGAISGPGVLEKTGFGKLILAGTNANTYSGETTVVNGTLRLAKSNGVQAVSNLVVQPNGRVEWGGSEQIADAATVTLENAAFSGVTNAHLRGFSETITDLTIYSSYVDASGGALTLLGDVDLTHDSLDWNFSSIFGTVRLGPGEHRIFSDVVNPSVGYTVLHLWNSVQETGGSASLSVLNTQLRLSGSNSFTGPLIVDGSPLGGGLLVRHPHALGSPAQGTILTNSAILDLAMPSGSVLAGESLVLANKRPGASQPCTLAMYGEFTNTWAGPITVQDTNLINITYGSKLTVDGTVSGPAPLYVEGGAPLILAGTQPNTVTDLVVSGGIVRLAKPPGVPAFTGNLFLYTSEFLFLPPQVILDAPGQFLPQTVASVGFGGTNATLNLNGHSATLRRLLGLGTVKIGAGTLTISNPTAQYSDFAGRLESAPGGLLLHQGIGTQRGGTFAMNGAAWLQGGTMYFDTGYIDAGLTINAGAVMDMFSPQALFGSLSGAGKLITSSGIIYVGANNTSTTFSGLIEGGGNTNLVKMGTGMLTLSGTSTHAGKMVVWDGTLLANGTLAGPVHVERSFGGATATLGGTGTLDNVVVTGLGSRLAPGATTASPSYGKLSVRNFALDAGALYLCEIGGTNAGVNLDQIEARDTATLLNGAASYTAFGAGAVSNRYAVLKSFAPVNGAFTGDPEGDTIFPAAGRVMKITYLTAAGKEVTLIEQPGANLGNIQIGGISRGTNGSITITGTGVSGAVYDVQANANLNTTNWIVIGTATGNFNGALTFTDTNAPSFPMRFYRFMLP